ncbi:hypothetical protein JQ631_16620 [Bradyrhizobium manausense]|uniref:hypothetical protein n=1 Tax=Bradyrhizobium manausense TaxID=989370 RepID=UPI001BABDA59|nr:hypothetical protein [Bradyrhizobium manausense]MBR0790700.1 hypothetical protein [Bradyrhizobium manausense]
MYTPTGDGASPGARESAIKNRIGEINIGRHPLIRQALRNVGHTGGSHGDLLRCGVTLCAALT